MLEITGTKGGLQATIVWNDGELIGTEWAVVQFGGFVARAEGRLVGYAGMERKHRHLQHADSVYWLARQWFDEGVDITGDLPSMPSEPGVLY